jgi:hypothetical protein
MFVRKKERRFQTTFIECAIFKTSGLRTYDIVCTCFKCLSCVSSLVTIVAGRVTHCTACNLALIYLHLYPAAYFTPVLHTFGRVLPVHVPVAHLVTFVPYSCRLSCNILKYDTSCSCFLCLSCRTKLRSSPCTLCCLSSSTCTA